MRNLKVIDGTGKRQSAPRPKKRGWTRALYDVCEANRGWSTEDEIAHLLPAAIETNLLVPHSKLERYLYSAVYLGYLIENDGRWNVAPLEYFESRVQYLKDVKGTRGQRRKAAKTKNLSYMTPDPRPFWHWHTMATVFLFGFVLGAVFGIALT